MTTQSWIIIFILIILVGISATPAYRNYRYWLQRKFGYWNILVPLLLILGGNLAGYVLSGQSMILFLIPLDAIFFIDVVATYFQIRRMQKDIEKRID